MEKRKEFLSADKFARLLILFLAKKNCSEELNNETVNAIIPISYQENIDDAMHPYLDGEYAPLPIIIDKDEYLYNNIYWWKGFGDEINKFIVNTKIDIDFKYEKVYIPVKTKDIAVLNDIDDSILEVLDFFAESLELQTIRKIEADKRKIEHDIKRIKKKYFDKK